ncbi:MAG TPA: GtrA family protein [Pseudomonadales bacterium]
MRFACTGIFVSALHATIALGLLRFVTENPAFANGVAYVVATAVSYALNTLWSFSSRPTGTTLRRFLTVSFGGLLVAMAVARLCELAGLEDWQGIVAVILVIPPLTFALHNFWTYR